MTPAARREQPQADLRDEDIAFRDERERVAWMYRELIETFPLLPEVIATEEARRMLGRVLARRNLAPTNEEQARIDACTDVATLERWVEQAISAKSVAEAVA